MSTATSIEWTDTTWNPLTGCTPLSPGCDHCYAQTLHERFNGAGSFAEITLHPTRLGQPFTWRAPRRVFVNSMSDLFHAGVPDEFIAEVFAIMLLNPQHTFQILTKRPARMRALLSSSQFRTQVWSEACALTTLDHTPDEYTDAWPLPNVWAGVSVENQKWASIRIPALLNTPAAVRWISAEPLLGPLDLSQWLNHPHEPAGQLTRPGLDWIVAGGESGPQARAMHPNWARTLRDQATGAGVAFLFKQWGTWAPDTNLTLPGTGLNEWPPMRRMSKKTAGRHLDGRTWDEYPAPATTVVAQ